MNLIGAWRRRLRERELLYGPKVLLPGGPEQWIEDTLDWLIGQFGTEPLRRPPVLPTAFVPKEYDGSERAAWELCVRVCAWMEVPDDRIRFSFRMEEVRAAARSAAVHRFTAEQPRELVALSGLQATMTPAEVAALVAEGFDAEIAVLTERELDAELRRTTAIAQETDPNRRADLYARAEAVWSAPAGSGSRACWIDLRTGGREGTAVMLSATTLAEPAAVVAAVAHELGHEVLWGYHLIDRQRRTRRRSATCSRSSTASAFSLPTRRSSACRGSARCCRALATWGSAARPTHWPRTASAGMDCGRSRCCRCSRPSSTGRYGSVPSRGSRRW